MSFLTDDLNHQTAAASFQAETRGRKMKSAIGKRITLNKTQHEPVVNGGFSFGKRTTPFKPSHSVCLDEENGLVIDEVYGVEMRELATNRDGREEVSTGRRITAPRIGQVGHIALNLSLDHVSVPQPPGDSELRPQPVNIEMSAYIVDDHSPVQIDVKWRKPENAEKFKSLAYQIDIKPESSSENWTTVACVRFPVFRVYHTNEKLLVGKVHLSRQLHDLIYLLRCRAVGEINQNNATCVLEGEWSPSVTLVFCRFQAEHPVGVFFNL